MPLNKPGAKKKPMLQLAMPSDDEDEVTDDVGELPGGERAAVKRQGSFQLSSTMTFEAGDVKLRGGRGMELSDGGATSSVTLEDLDRLQQLGAGATSRVFLAQHRSTGERYALKELTVMADNDLRHMAVNELRLAHKASQGDHLIKFIDAFFNEGKICICMEFADAGSLDDVIQRGTPRPGGAGPPARGVPEPMVGVMMLQALQGLLYLHREMKQMHRDLKPANVMLTKGGTVKLSDFGISKQLESTDSLAVTQCGTTQYMSPERLLGKPYSFASDVWSTGVMILEALHGQMPYPNARSFIAQVQMICSGDAPACPDGTSDELCALCALCLRKETDGAAPRPNVPQLFRNAWVQSYAEDGSDEERCARIAAFVRLQLGEARGDDLELLAGSLGDLSM